jgi:hypothetical protein
LKRNQAVPQRDRLFDGWLGKVGKSGQKGLRLT